MRFYWYLPLLVFTLAARPEPVCAQLPPVRLRTLVLHPPSSFCTETARPPASFDTAREDHWLAPDKAKHAGASFLLVLSSQYALTSKAGLSQDRALPLSMGVSAAVGVAKELYDWKVGSKQYFSPRDLAADGVGILLAMGFILL